MKRLTGVQFKRAGRVYYFDCAGMDEIKAGAEVIVETELGLGLGKVVFSPKDVEDSEAPPDLKRVVRFADKSDFERERKNRDREDAAFDLCSKLIKQKNLEMKLVNVEYFYDASKAIFFFSAEHRVDFRDLVRDLARSLHTRIEMKQIGVRDETKMMGGLGCCGQPVCCAAFLREFQPVSVKMAKEQNLAMNPTKISGLCGRLMCCLAYEHETYEELSKDIPKKGRTIDTPEGPAKVIDVNVIKKLVTLSLESGGTITMPAEKLCAPCSQTRSEPPPDDDLDMDLPEVTPLDKETGANESAQNSGKGKDRHHEKKQLPNDRNNNEKNRE